MNMLKSEKSVKEISDKHGATPDAVRRAIAQGTHVEREHTNDDDTARRIASHHVFELLDYYDRLKSVEEENSGPRLSEKLLNEGLNDLYHATNLRSFYRILYDDLFELSYGRGDAESEIGSKPFFASFSRIPANRYRSHGADVTLVVDGDKLRHRHKITPVDYWQMGGGGSESEERLFSNKPAISPFKQYLKAVHVYYDGNEERQRQYDGLQHLMIPVYVYKDRKAYFLLDTRRAQTAKDFIDSLGDAPLVPQPYQSTTGESELMRMDALLDFLDSGGKIQLKPWYDRLKYYHRDFVEQLACDVHNLRSKKGLAVRKIWQRFESLLAKYGTTSIRGFAKAFITKHGH